MRFLSAIGLKRPRVPEPKWEVPLPILKHKNLNVLQIGMIQPINLKCLQHENSKWYYLERSAIFCNELIMIVDKLKYRSCSLLEAKLQKFVHLAITYIG
jgi:hypothetical protein